MTHTEILAEARRLVRGNSTSYPTSEIVESENRALERIAAIIRNAQGRWQWDDSNQTDLPSATTSISSGIGDYDTDPTHYRISRVEVKDTGGNWVKLVPLDPKDVVDASWRALLEGTGTPQYYDKVGDSLILYPTPDYSQAASLAVYYERGPNYFTTSDTTKAPGFNPLFHRLLPLWAAYDHALINRMDSRNDLRRDIQSMEEALESHYLLRDRDEHVRLASRPARFK